MSALSLGKAASDGDCFFDALAQYINLFHDTDVNTTKYLRKLCHEYYCEHKDEVDGWNKAEYASELSVADEYYMVQYTAQECQVDFYGRPPIWGRPAIEGMILCRQLNLDGILVIEVLEDPEIKGMIPSYHFVDI